MTFGLRCYGLVICSMFRVPPRKDVTSTPKGEAVGRTNPGRQIYGIWPRDLPRNIWTQFGKQMLFEQIHLPLYIFHLTNKSVWNNAERFTWETYYLLTQKVWWTDGYIPKNRHFPYSRDYVVFPFPCFWTLLAIMWLTGGTEHPFRCSDTSQKDSHLPCNKYS